MATDELWYMAYILFSCNIFCWQLKSVENEMRGLNSLYRLNKNKTWFMLKKMLYICKSVSENIILSLEKETPSKSSV